MSEWAGIGWRSRIPLPQAEQCVFHIYVVVDFEHIFRVPGRTTRSKPKPDDCGPLKRAAAGGEVRVEAFSRGGYPGKRLGRGAPELRSAGYWDAPSNQTWGLDWHCNEGIEIGFLEAGSLPFEVETQSRLLKAGSITITRPWQRHKVGNPCVPASRYHWIIIDVGVRHPNQTWRWPDWLLLPLDELATLTKFLRQNERPAWRVSEALSRGFVALGEAVRGDPTPRNTARVKLLINEILLSLLELLQQKRPHLDESLSSSERTVRLFLQNLPQQAGEPWTLESLSAECGLGRSLFSYHCKQITNRTPLEYLTQCRIEAAMTALREDRNRSITEIAFECGFQSSQYFATVFLRQTGRSPRDFRSAEPG